VQFGFSVTSARHLEKEAQWTIFGGDGREHSSECVDTGDWRIEQPNPARWRAFEEASFTQPNGTARLSWRICVLL
jgi:hypothetical protein